MLSLIATILVVGRPAAAQELPFRTDYQALEPRCPSWEPPARTGERMRDAAHELSTQASQALIVGDLEEARDLFEQAARLDGRSVDLHYGLARVLEQIGRLDSALAAYCRVLALEADSTESSGTVTDARMRRDELVQSLRLDVPYTARAVFDRGARSASEGDHARAADQFRLAAERAPHWPAAVYNEGVALDRLGRAEAAAGRLARYLELTPDAQDAVEVARRIGQLERARARGGAGTSADAALALGFVVPGFGQIYSGRSAAGLVVISAVAGAVAGGFLVRKVDVRCLSTPEPGASCPPDDVVSRRVTTPYLTPALVAAGAVTVLAAVEAWIRGGEASAPGSGLVSADGAGLSMNRPHVSVGADRSVEVVLLGLSFP
jgi:tetratricopeptide (TPR) repeat protein